MSRERRQDRLKAAYGDAHQRLMRVLYIADPEHMGRSVGAPEDEYSDVATRLMTSLRGATTADQARAATLAMYPNATEDLIKEVTEVWRVFSETTATDRAVD
jgi:hypothetical protein